MLAFKIDYIPWEGLLIPKKVPTSAAFDPTSAAFGMSTEQEAFGGGVGRVWSLDEGKPIPKKAKKTTKNRR